MIIQLSALPSDAGHCPHAPCRNTEVSELNQVAPRCVLSVAESGLTLTNYMYAISREANHGARYGFTLYLGTVSLSTCGVARGWWWWEHRTQKRWLPLTEDAGLVYYFGQQGSD